MARARPLDEGFTIVYLPIQYPGYVPTYSNGEGACLVTLILSCMGPENRSVCK